LGSRCHPVIAGKAVRPGSAIDHIVASITMQQIVACIPGQSVDTVTAKPRTSLGTGTRRHAAKVRAE
jgi:hypothetical protein